MNYEEDDKTFNHNAYSITGWKGIAWTVLGWETEPDKDTEWSGFERRTGKIVAVMIGDDRLFSFDQDEITPLKDTEYCRSCGQIGCKHNVISEET